jgi:3-deoxy-manno-octulosonate cytidylyltransferase (CMP-KDO synthetase)
MKVLGVIPARYASTRFEGKALADLLGKPMIQHVYERASRASTLDGVVVATDDQRIFETVRGFEGEVVMTAEHPTGTDRVAEVAHCADAEIFVNIQGDEPLIEPAMIDEAVEPLLRDAEKIVTSDKLRVPPVKPGGEKPVTSYSSRVTESDIDLATLVHRIGSEEEYLNPNVVKVAVDRAGFAMYFSRSPIPYIKGRRGWGKDALIYRHVGLYVYRQHALLDFAQMPPTPFETLEGLEQLRFLENGYRMKVVETSYKSVGVDTPEDLTRVRRIMRSE